MHDMASHRDRVVSCDGKRCDAIIVTFRIEIDYDSFAAMAMCATRALRPEPMHGEQPRHARGRELGIVQDACLVGEAKQLGEMQQ